MASVVRRMNEVTLRRAWLVLGWVTVFGRVYHHGTLVGWLEFNVPFQHKNRYIKDDITVHNHRSTQPCIPPGSLNRVLASAGGKGWNVTSAGWQVTLCDPIYGT